MSEFGGVGLDMTMQTQVWYQTLSVLVTIVWSGVVSIAAFIIVNKLVGMRVSLDTEQMGLDLTEHQEQAYDLV